MRILDIGGGFAGGSFDSTGTVQLGQVPFAVNTALATYFPDPSVKVSWRYWPRLSFCHWYACSRLASGASAKGQHALHSKAPSDSRGYFCI